MINRISVSVIIPCYNEELYIENCINSILKQDFSADQTEIIVVDGNSNDKTLQILNKFPQIKLFNNPKKIVPISMNIGIKNASGDFIIRIDSHCIYPKNYISELIKNSLKYNADNIGTVMHTIPANESTKAKAIALALSHPLGVGNSYFRIGSSRVREVDTVPFGCYRKSIFKNIGLYDEQLIRNQDDELNGRLKQSGGKIILLPHVILKYYARDTIKKVYSMFYQYGFFKPLVNKKLKSPTSFRQFIPIFFVFGVLFGPILAVFNIILLKFYFYSIIFYLLLLLIYSLSVTIKKNLKFSTPIFLIAAFFTIHWSYGWGYINGILNLKKLINE